jgi:uncharacterized membrane protein
MRLFGHPVHVMLVHFPVALWPAHTALHVFASQLPAGVSAVAGFWLLVGGVGLGWLAAGFGAADLLEIWRAGDYSRLNSGITHAAINGAVLLGFTCLLAVEYSSYPEIRHGAGILATEAALLVAMGVGNYFGGAVIWPKTPRA